jgi:hypothetical protein
MKNRLSIIGLFVILLIFCIFLSGCGGDSFALNAPGCTATWNDDVTWVAWSWVEGAEYYVIYGKEYNKKNNESPPSKTKEFKVIETRVTKSPFAHKTRDDYSYAVKAFKKNGDSSDYSNVAFTW